MKNSIKKRENWIDALKGIAICGVVMIHSGAGQLPSFYGRIGAIGQNGVQLFFLIAAYFAFKSYDRYHPSNFTIRSYLIWEYQKFLRLAPLYYLSLVVCLFFPGWLTWLPPTSNKSVLNILFHIFFLHGTVPNYSNSILRVEWYLGVLALFYFILPMLYYAINSLEKAFYFATTSIITCTLLLEFLMRHKSISNQYLSESYLGTYCFFTQFPILTLGILFFFVENTDFLSRVKNKILFSYLLLFVAIVILVGITYDKTQVFGISRLTLFGLCFLIIIVSQYAFPCPIINNKIFIMLGRYSYGIFLFHFLLIYIYEKNIVSIFNDNILNWLFKYLLILLFSFFISFLLTNYFEKPIIRVLNKFH